MRLIRTVAAIVCFLLWGPIGYGQTGSMTGFCSQGGTRAALSGMLSTNYQQGVIPSCTVTVYLTGTTNLATIYSNSTSTPLSNPFTATTSSSSAPGQWTFWASNAQLYDVVGSGGVSPNTYAAPVTLVTAGGVAGEFGNYLPLSGGTLYGSLFAPNINGEMYPASCSRSPTPSWCSGTTPDAWIRAACGQLPSSGGVINLLGLNGVIAASVTCSTPTKQVAMLEDPTSTLTISESDGGTAFPIDNGSMFLGPGAGQCNFAGGVHLGSSANVTAIIGPAHTDGTQESMNVSGACLYGASGATVTQGLLFADRVFANSIFEGNVLGVCNTACAKIRDTGEMDLVNNWLNVGDGITTITGIPLVISGSGLGNGCNVGPVNVWGGQIEHALGGSAFQEISIAGDGTGLVLACDIHIHDLGIERSPSGTPGTTGITVTDCKNCSFENIVATGNSAGSADMIRINASIANSTQNVVVRNISNIFNTYSNTLNDTTNGGTVLPVSTVPFITTYYSNPGYVQPPVLPANTIESLGSDVMSGAGNFATGSGTIGTGFVDTGCNAGISCTYTRTSVTAPPGLTWSQEIQITANSDTSAGFNGVQWSTPVSFVANQVYVGSFWAKGDGTFTGQATFLLWNSLVPTFYCQGTSPNQLTNSWQAYSFACVPTTSGSSNIAIAADTLPGETGTFWMGGFTFAPVAPLSPGSLLASVSPYGIGPATNGSLKVFSGVGYSTGYTGSTVDVRVNACIADAINLAGGNTTGICNASGETGIQNTAAQINVGNSSGPQVTLIVPAQGQWRGAMTDGTSCTVNQYGNTAILGAGPESGIGTQFVFGATASSNLGCVFKTTPLGSQLNYIHDSNFAIVNVNGGSYVGHVTTGGIGANFVGSMFDSSTVDHVVVFDALDATAAQVAGFCCGAVFRNLSINGNYGSGVTPLVITNTSAFNLETLSVVHPGAGKPIIQFTDSSAHTSNVNIHGLYMETSNSDTSTALLQNSGYGSINLSSVTAKAEVASDAATIMTSTNTTNTGITIDGLNAVNGSGDFFYPVTAVNNSFTGEVIKTDNTSSKGNLGYYGSSAPFLYSAAGTPLPACSAAMKGKHLEVSDATTPTFLGTYASGGAVQSPVTCNGTSWVTF